MATIYQQPYHRRVFERAPAKYIRERHKCARIGLIRRREDMDLTRPELASKIGIGREYVFAVETGSRNPSLDLMERWSRALGNAPLDLFAKVG